MLKLLILALVAIFVPGSAPPDKVTPQCTYVSNYVHTDMSLSYIGVDPNNSNNWIVVVFVDFCGNQLNDNIGVQIYDENVPAWRNMVLFPSSPVVTIWGNNSSAGSYGACDVGTVKYKCFNYTIPIASDWGQAINGGMFGAHVDPNLECQEGPFGYWYYYHDSQWVYKQ